MSLKVLSIASHYSFPYFWHLNCILKNDTFLRISKSRPIFWHLHKNRSAAQLGYVPSTETNDNRKGQYVMNAASEVGLSI